MNKRDAAEVLGVLAAAFRSDLDEATVAVWYQSTLCQVDPNVASETVSRLIRDDQWFPTPARFNEVRRAVEARREPFKALPAPSMGEQERERVKALIKRTHDELYGDKQANTERFLDEGWPA